MKKFVLNNLVESEVPPTSPNVLWVEKGGNGDIKAIHRYGKQGWEPYLVSVDYMRPVESEEVTEQKKVKSTKKK